MWMRYGGDKETINRLPRVVAYEFPTACEEPTCSACTSYLSDADEVYPFHWKCWIIWQVHHIFDYCPPQWPHAGLRHHRPVVVLFKLYHRGTNLPI
ncbi:hypothetical protein TNCV_341191 [Trichonephila clavipes]|nr:hypothetical protein TNCV_341191 [Trichonephila clavipes]